MSDSAAVYPLTKAASGALFRAKTRQLREVIWVAESLRRAFVAAAPPTTTTFQLKSMISAISRPSVAEHIPNFVLETFSPLS
jgi:hypothetical protein